MKKFFIAFLVLCSLASYSQTLNKFSKPEDEYRPWIFWSWLNNMVTKKGISSDLEEFKKFGVRGTLIMLIGSETKDRQMYENNNMPHPVTSQTPEFFDMWKFAAEESARLGLSINTQLGPGWCHSGGPEVKPDQAVQHLVFTETEPIKGPSKNVKLILDTTNSIMLGNAYHSELEFKDEPQWVQIKLPKATRIDKVILHPFTNKDIVGFGFPVQFKIEVANKADFSDKKTFYQTQKDFLATQATAAVLTGKFSGQYVRVTSTKNYSVFRSNKTQYLFSLAEVEVISDNKNIAVNSPITASSTIENFGYSLKALTDNVNKSSFRWANNIYTLGRPGAQYFTADVAIVAFPDKKVVNAKEIIDLTYLIKNGQLSWTLPAGNWIIRRYAMRNALAYNRPAPTGGKGLECDKFDKDAVNAMFTSMVGRYLKDSPELVGKTIKSFEADSWEVGNPEWTYKFKSEFIKRRGYDPTPWMITYKTNQIVESIELTKRFLNDMYLTQTDLFADNFFTHLANKADSLGMDFMTEPYTAPFDPIRMAGRVQVPMCEFWVSTEMMHTARWASSAANTYGRKTVLAEGFTGRWNDGNWKMDPYAIKRVGDLAFANGVNKIALHAAALQPWGTDLKPGMPMYFWGTNFIPGQTWWKPGSAWINYISRCQYMLSQGKNVADIVGLMPTLDWKGAMPEGLHKKYNYDLMSLETLLNDMDYSDGYFRLPSGANYRILFLPKTYGKMDADILTKLLRLAKKGGTIVCQDKPLHSPSLTDYPEIDVKIKGLVKQLWGNADGKTVYEHKVGEGKLIWMNEIWTDTFDPERKYFMENRTKNKEFWGNPAVTTHWSPSFIALLRSIDQPDVEVVKASGEAMAWGGMPETAAGVRAGEDAIAWIHRRNNDIESYFISSQVATENNAELLFRVKNKIPQIWDPETGKQYRVKWAVQKDGRIKINIPFTPFGSVFVIFTPEIKGEQLPLYNGKKYTESSSLSEKWQVSFPAGFGAPLQASLNVGSLTDSKIFGIKYFSGTATYQTTIDITPKQLKRPIAIDLGTVKNLAEVIINGIVADTLWKPPFRSEISHLLKPGKNTITLKITNTWWNRTVGDMQLPEDLEWNEKLVYAGNDYKGYELKQFPKWIWSGEQRPSKNRVTFSPWRFVEKDSPLEPAGLIGPVKLLLSN